VYHNVLAAAPSSVEPADRVSDEVRFLFCQVNIKMLLCQLLVRYVCPFVYPRNNYKFSKFVKLSSSTKVDPLFQILVERDTLPEEPHGLLHANRV
jgi:hypothetical protein